MVKRLPTMQETQVQSLGQEDLPEKEMATHSSILAWKIPWTEKPGGYTPWGCKESDTTERLNTPPTCLSKQTGVFLIMPLISKFLSIQLLFISEFVHFFPVSLELPLLMIQDPPTSPLGDCNSLLSGPSASILSRPQPRPCSTQKTGHSSKAQRRSYHSLIKILW